MLLKRATAGDGRAVRSVEVRGGLAWAPAPVDKFIVSVVPKNKETGSAEPSLYMSPDAYEGAGSLAASVAVCVLVAGAAGWGFATKYPVRWHLCKCLIAMRAEDAWHRCKGAWRSSSASAAAVAASGVRTTMFSARPGRAESPLRPTRRDSDTDMPEPEQ